MAVNPFVKLVAPVTVPPVNEDVVLNPVTVKVPPVLFVKVATPFVYVPPVNLISVGRFWYVVALIVFAVRPPLVTMLNVTDENAPDSDKVGIVALMSGWF